MTFLFSIADPLGIDTAAIRRVVASTRKAVNITCLKHDGEPEYFTNAGNGLKGLIDVLEFNGIKGGLLERVDLPLQGLIDCQSGVNGLVCV